MKEFTKVAIKYFLYIKKIISAKVYQKKIVENCIKQFDNTILTLIYF